METNGIIAKTVHCTICEFGAGWMDDLLFYILFNSISVILGPWEGGNGRLCAMESCLYLIRLLFSVGVKLGNTCIPAQHLTKRATGAPLFKFEQAHILHLIDEVL